MNPQKKPHSPFFVPMLVCGIITIILGVILLSLSIGDGGKTDPPETGSESESEKESEKESETAPPDSAHAVSFRADLGGYEKYMNPAATGEYLILVNKEHPVDAAFVPADLVPVRDANKEISLRECAEKALEAMFTEMRAEGYTDVFVTSAYRSFDYQTSLFGTYIQREMRANPNLTMSEARELVLRYSAAPGTSEHQTGLCVDLMTASMTDLDESFALHPIYAWLLGNAWKFGFILRFPEGKENVTGYDYEPWHYRFVGREDAWKIHAAGLTLEEYLSQEPLPAKGE